MEQTLSRKRTRNDVRCICDNVTCKQLMNKLDQLRVQASAVRYNHVYFNVLSYFGVPKEKALVELWGPRLKKCPAVWVMLSDRGFWNTARFYPNLNRQLTPKFLSGRKQITAEEVSADS